MLDKELRNKRMLVLFKKLYYQPSIVAYAFNTSTQEAAQVGGGF